MSNLYLPEGRLLHTQENQTACSSLSALRQAQAQELVLEGVALLCTPEHDLILSVGPFSGRIPRTECALGIREGTTREISILSRVGKPVSFTVMDVQETVSGPQLLLSRRRAQELALSHLLRHAPPGTVLPATVTHLESFGVFVDLGCGFPSMVGIDSISVARISHPACRFSVGQEIFVVVTGSNRASGRIFLSHKELLGTWEENAAGFSPGMTVSGYVRGIKDYGFFIELTPNLTGLADRTHPLVENDRVSVFIKSILPEKMKLKLALIHRLEPSAPPPLCYYITEGQLNRWQYSPCVCSRTVLATVFS